MTHDEVTILIVVAFVYICIGLFIWLQLYMHSEWYKRIPIVAVTCWPILFLCQIGREIKIIINLIKNDKGLV